MCSSVLTVRTHVYEWGFFTQYVYISMARIALIWETRVGPKLVIQITLDYNIIIKIITLDFTLGKRESNKLGNSGQSDLEVRKNIRMDQMKTVQQLQNDSHRHTVNYDFCFVFN